jgi:hypothetical protein
MDNLDNFRRPLVLALFSAPCTFLCALSCFNNLFSILAENYKGVDRSLDKRAKVVGKLTYILDLLAQGNQFSQEAFRALLARSVQELGPRPPPTPSPPSQCVTLKVICLKRTMLFVVIFFVQRSTRTGAGEL